MPFPDNTKLYTSGPNEVAGLIDVDREEMVITWVLPGGRQRAFDIATILDDTVDSFVFLDGDGRKFRLLTMTTSHYNEHVREPGKVKYPNDEAMLHAYRQSLK